MRVAQCHGFTIWNAGREGRRLYASLAPRSRAAVRAFADVDARKLTLGHYAPPGEPPQRRIPIVHFRSAGRVGWNAPRAFTRPWRA